MMSGDFYIEENNLVNQPGVDYGQSCPTVLAVILKQKFIVIHQKGCSAWAGIGATAYHPACISFGKFEEIKVEKTRFKVVKFKELFEFLSTKTHSIKNAEDILAELRRKNENL